MMCDEKWILYNNQWWQAQCLDQEETPKHFWKPNLHPKKAHGHCLMVCCWSGPLQVSESQWNHYIWEVRSAHQWDALKTATSTTSMSQQNGPNSRQSPAAYRTTNTLKPEWIGLRSFASFAICTWSHANWLLLLQASQQLFAGENASTTSRTHEIFSKSSLNLEAWIIFATGINKPISQWQKCVDYNGSYVD